MAKRVMLAVAGAGKTYMLCHAIDPAKKNLILAYTHENIRNICNELVQRFGCVPALTNVLTFDSFVYRYILRPYEPMILGIFNQQSYAMRGITIAKPPAQSILRNKRWLRNPSCPTKDKFEHYTKNGFYYNDTLPELLVYAQEKAKVLDKAADALNKTYSQIMIDEFQDFREYDFDLIVAIAKRIENIVLVGDYYQHSVSAVNNTGKPFKKSKGYLSYDEFIALLTKNRFLVDNTTLSASRRCPQKICDFVASKLGIPITANNEHTGEVIWLTPETIPSIFENNQVPKLVFSEAQKYSFKAINWSYSKGDTMDSVCVVLTDDLSNMDDETFSVAGLSGITINKLYVALTRTKGDLFLVKQKDFKKVKQRYLIK